LGSSGYRFRFFTHRGISFYSKGEEKQKIEISLRDELDTKYFQLGHKKDTLNNIIKALDKNEIIPGTAVKTADAVFNNNAAALILILNPTERDVVQNVYSRMKIVDQFLENFEDRLIFFIKDKIVDHPFQIFITRVNEIIENCNIAQELIQSFLDNNPVDIYKRKNGNSIIDREFVGVVTAEQVKRERGA
jgi:hypothetical protein